MNPFPLTPLKNYNEKDMDEKDKDLLLKDISGRLPYGVKTSYIGYEMTIRGVDVESKTVDVIDCGKARFAAVRIEKIKPYLRPLSSMTEEERKEYNDLYYQVPIQRSDGNAYRDTKMVETLHIDWLNKNMFDHRGLIPKGLALEAKDGMYNN